MRRLCAVALGLGLAWGGAAQAEPQVPRESAWAPAEGTWSVGVFNPLRWQITSTVAVEAHPLAFLAAPHAGVDWQVARGQGLLGQDWALAARFGLAAPAWTLRFGLPLGLKGYLGPSCQVADTGEDRPDTCQGTGWAVAPSAGGRFTWGRDGLLTVDADVAAGIMLSGDRPAPLDTYAPLELAVAPLTHGWRAHLGLRTEHRLAPWARVAAELDLYRVGDRSRLSPWTVSGWLGADFPLSDGFALTAGVIWFNADQGAIDLVDDGDGYVRVARVRSNDVYPTLDALWTW
ncbi:MAG: hypothetical protein KC613_19055 [Myxococcales bacterium]|nr:hypothetical protein [Myxococcales bacterium]MCB9522942.1 hypothetical protein [Myxococcales bacterium]